MAVLVVVDALTYEHEGVTEDMFMTGNKDCCNITAILSTIPEKVDCCGHRLCFCSTGAASVVCRDLGLPPDVKHGATRLGGTITTVNGHN